MARSYFLRPASVHSGRAASLAAAGHPNTPPERAVKHPDLPGAGVGTRGKGSRAGSGPLTPGTAIPRGVPDPETGGAGENPPGLVNCAISERSEISGRLSFLKFCYDEAPVVGFRMYRNDIVTVRAARYPDELAERLDGAERGKIEFLSMKSRRRLALLAGNCGVAFRSFVTATYPKDFPTDGLEVKRHLHSLLAALRRKCPGLSYLWFLEFQKRGAPHFHLFLSASLPSPLSEMNRSNGRTRKTVRVHWPWQDWLSSLWFGIVGSGDEKHLRAGAAWEVIEKPDGAARYVSKESYKTFQKVVPTGFQNVGRFWGCSKDISAESQRDVSCSLADMRKIFGPECFDEQGNPFPVIFGAADSYRKIIDTPADPAKVRAWKSGSRQKDLTLTNEFGQPGTVGSSPLGKSWQVSEKYSTTRNRRHAQGEWHGSTSSNLTISLAIAAKES